MRRLTVELPVAKLTRLAQVVEAEIEPTWPFVLRPEFVAGSCVRFTHKGIVVATGAAEQLQSPVGLKDPWHLWLSELRWVADSTN